LRTISVKEAASALGITPRAVTYRLDKGQLKGTLSKNDFGVPEWRIYPNKEILKGLGDATSVETSSISFEPGDVVEAETIEPAQKPEGNDSDEQRTTYTADFQTIVEQCVRPLVEEVKAQALALAERDRIIEEQGRQLRLLPDLQKQAEEERRAADLRALEVTALRKQIDALGLEKEQAEEAANQARSKLQSTEALKAEIQEQLQGMRSELEKVKQPWWKKWLSLQD
jgi:hypothetical protein